MDSTTYFKTQNGCSYLYDLKNSYLLNIHPIIDSIWQSEIENETDNLSEKLKSLYPELSFSDISYYIRKYKFFKENGFIVGSVPVYLGAPNIMDFAPGDTCFIDVTQFENPRALADFINAYYQEESLFEQFFYWKQKTLRREFSEKAEAQQIPPFARLCQQIKERLLIR